MEVLLHVGERRHKIILGRIHCRYAKVGFEFTELAIQVENSLVGWYTCCEGQFDDRR